MELPRSGAPGGFSGNGCGQAPPGSGYPVADLDGLMREVQAVLDNDSDTEVQQTMRQHYHDRPRGRRPEMRAVLRMTALMVYNWRVGGGRLSPRRALIILALVDWDQALAQYHLDHPQPRRQEPEGDREADGSDEEDGEESEESGSNGPEDRFSVMRLLNRDVDRKVAKRNQPDDSKLHIRIRHPGGKRDTTFTYPRQPVDWTQPLKLVNRWRSQILRRNLGPARPFRAHFHADEKEWLYQEHLRFESQCRNHGQVVDYSAMNWGEIVARFNHEFAGKVLSGSSKRRPTRTKVSLRTERARIKKVTEHTGIQPQTQGAKASRSKGAAQEAEEEEEEEEDEADYGPISTRRGDPPPGKPPRRDDDDSQGGGLGGQAWRGLVRVEG